MGGGTVAGSVMRHALAELRRTVPHNHAALKGTTYPTLFKVVFYTDFQNLIRLVLPTACMYISHIFYICDLRSCQAGPLCSTAGFSSPGRGRGRAEVSANSFSSQATVEKTDVEQEIIFCSRAAKMMARSRSTAQHSTVAQ